MTERRSVATDGRRTKGASGSAWSEEDEEEPEQEPQSSVERYSSSSGGTRGEMLGS